MPLYKATRDADWEEDAEILIKADSLEQAKQYIRDTYIKKTNFSHENKIGEEFLETLEELPETAKGILLVSNRGA